MNHLQFEKILQEGEGTTIEFKTSKEQLNKDVFETICAFLNRTGGFLILGVTDKKEISGINETAVQRILDSLVVNANNPQKLNPPYYLIPQVMEYQNKKLITTYIPESSQVHSTAGRIYDRNEDGDFNITNYNDLVAQMYLRKQRTYSENQVYPFVKMEDLDFPIFDRVRSLVKNQRKNHPWEELSNEDLMRSAGLYKRDRLNGKEGITLAGILLFGTEELIKSVLPFHKTDAILRVNNIDRYDDRDDIKVNLIESYLRLMSFVRKHLPDKFYLENDQRISLRDNLFREIVGNLLVHREYSNPFPAKFIIENEMVYTENWNKPNCKGNIDPANFSPYPKNPIIAGFFKEIGWVDELGSGVRNSFKYCELYNADTTPIFIENDVFKAIIPIAKLTTHITTQMTTQITAQMTTQKGNSMDTQQIQNKILDSILNYPNISRKDLSEILGDITEDGVKYHLDKLKSDRIIKRVGSTRGYWKVIKKNNL